MKTPTVILGLVVVAVAASADTLNLTGVASGTSRFNDHFADSFGQVNLTPEGFWKLSNPGEYYNTGYDVFPNGANFALGTMSYDSITGVGLESAAITGLTGNWFLNVDPSWGPYSTVYSGVTGTAQFQDGALLGLNLASTVTFTYTAGPLNGAPYAGTFGVSGDNWTLHADNTFGLPVRHEWDFSGTIAVVPEPSSLALLGVGAAAFCLYRLRRRN